MNEETPRIETVELLKPELPKPEAPKLVTVPSSVVFARMQQNEQITRLERYNLRRLYKQGVFNSDEVKILVENGIIPDPEIEQVKQSIFSRIPEFGMQILGALLMKNARTTLAGLATALPVLIMGISSLISGDTPTGIKNVLEALGIILVGFFAKDAITSESKPAQ